MTNFRKQVTFWRISLLFLENRMRWNINKANAGTDRQRSKNIRL